MASPGLNSAVTKDGEIYNKLQRPDDYLMAATSRPPPLGTAVPPAAYSSKRKRGQVAASGRKRARAGAIFVRTNTGDTAEECGMRTVLPGGSEEEQLSDDSTSEALAYLRSVRSEASMIPPLLVAPMSESDDENGVHSPNNEASDTHRLVYNDGTWIALDEEYEDTYGEDEWDEDYINLDPQETCYNVLLKRFRSLRQQIFEADRRSPNQSTRMVSKNPDSSQPPRSKRAWLQTINRDYPTVGQIFQLDERDLYFGLQSCALSLSQSTTISREKCCWIWSLLALTGDMGTLDFERISKIRELGLQAGRLSVQLRESSTRHHGNGNEHASADDFGERDEDFVRHDGEVAIENSEDTKPEMATDLPQELETEEVGKISLYSPEVGDDKHHGGSMEGDTSESEAEMSMSENEDQIHDNTGTKDLEEARARLLAQLGDRLVQPRVPSSRVEAERQRQEMQGREPREETVQHVHDEDRVSQHLNAGSFVLVEADWNTKAAIDMILTVVAECYGQKDLLQYRAAW